MLVIPEGTGSVQGRHPAGRSARCDWCNNRCDAVRRWWQPAVAEAGLAPLTFYELRHTFVAPAIAAGADAKQVSVRAGHSSVASTLDRYGHLHEDREDLVTDRLEAMFTSARPAAYGTVRPLR